MGSPLQRLWEALEAQGLNTEERILVIAGLDHPLALQEMADWVVDHPKATWQELMTEVGRLIKKYMINS